MTAVRAIVIGGSAGSMAPLEAMLRGLPESFPIPILIVRHLHATDCGSLARRLRRVCSLPVSEAIDKQPIEPGHVYTAPANYHMLAERDETIALSIDPKVHWARPSIDVLFESAAAVWGAGLAAVILSGASSDGTDGLGAVKAAGGIAVAQDPQTSEMKIMTQTPVEAGVVDSVLSPDHLAAWIQILSAFPDEPPTDALTPNTQADHEE